MKQRSAAALTSLALSVVSVPTAAGGGEHEEFRRQSREFAAAWRARGFACQEFDLPGLNHFDMGQQFNNPDNPFLKAMFDMIR